MGKLNKKVKHKIKMDLKTGMLAMVVGIVIVFGASSVSGYTYVESHTETSSGWSCTTSSYSSSNQYIGAICDSGYEGMGYAKARSGNGLWSSTSNSGLCCLPPKHFKAKAIAGGMTYRYVWVGCE